jgi:drug/metabolite transporter (DMT)-like permease
VTLPRSSLWKAFWATLLFASVPACVRVIRMDSYALGLWRLVLSAAGMTAILLATRQRTTRRIAAEVRRDWKVLTAVGVCFGLHWLTYFLSIKIGSASIGTLGFSTCGVQLPLLAWAFGFGRPQLSAVAGVTLAMAGSFLCVPETESGNNAAVGMAIGILSGTLYAALPMLHQRHARLDHELRTWAQFVFALPVFLLTAPAAQWLPISTGDFWMLLHLGLLVTLVGHYLWVQVTTELPLTVTSALGYIQLPVTLAFNYVLIREPITLAMLIGAGFIVVGNILALGYRRRRREVELEPPPA